MRSAFGVEISKFQTAPSKKPSNKEVKTGLALNGLAIAGGGHAAYMTGRDIVHEAKGGTVGRHMAPETVGRVGAAARKVKILKPILENPKRAALASLAGWGVLHTAELGGDAIANRSLRQQLKKRDARHMPRHPLTPRKTVPDDISPILPASTVKAYDNSRHHKGEAAALNLGSKLGAGAAGGLVGAAAAAKVLPKARFFREASTVAGKTISADKKVGFAASSLGGSVGGAAGGTAGALTLRHIQKNPRYRYRRS